MAKQAYIFEVSETNFDTLVLDNSNKMPVVVEFMSVSSEPCIILEQRLSDMAQEFAEQFVFAKVDIYTQPDLAKAFRIDNVPSTLVFVNGDIQHTEVGQLTKDEITVLLRRFGVYRQSDDMRLQAREHHLSGDTPSAIELLTQAAKIDPTNPRVAMDMVQILLDLDQLDSAVTIFNQLPNCEKESEIGKTLIGQITFKQLAAKTPGLATLAEGLETDPDNPKMRFDLAICLIAQYEYDQAAKQLLALQQQQPDFQNGAAREMLITLCNMLAPNDPTRAQRYRQQLNNLLN